MTTNGGAFTVTLVHCDVNADGSATVVLRYTSATGHDRGVRALQVPVAGAIVDPDGGVVSATVPAALTTDINTFLTQLNSLLSTAATGGKLDL